MSMLKKTIILTHCKEVGKVTIVRIGTEVGVKVTLLDELPKEKLFFALKVGNEPEFVAEINHKTSEYAPEIAVMSGDIIGVILLGEKGNVYGAGGRRELVNIKNVRAEISKNTALPDESQAENTQASIHESQNTDEIETKNHFIGADAHIEPKPDAFDRFGDNDGKTSLGKAVNAMDEDEQTVKPPDIATGEDKLTDGTEITLNGNEQKEQPTTIALDGDGETEQSENTLGGEDEQIEESTDIVDSDKSSGGRFSPPTGENFYRTAREKLDEIFTIYPKDQSLSEIIPESEWVRVGYDGDDYYLVGVLKNEGKVSHIGYGIPGNAKVKPPKEVADICDFLPMPGSPETGWWLMFQSPEDGSMLSSLKL